MSPCYPCSWFPLLRADTPICVRRLPRVGCRHAADTPASGGALPGRAARGANPGHAGEESEGGGPVSWSSLPYSPSREMRELLLRRGLAVPLRGEGSAQTPAADRAEGILGALGDPGAAATGAGAMAGDSPVEMRVDRGGLQRHLSRLGVSPPERDAPPSHLGALAAASAGRPWATGALRLSADWPASLALALPSSQTAAFRPWDRNDLQRRISTFKPSTWFAKPQVHEPPAAGHVALATQPLRHLLPCLVAQANSGQHARCMPPAAR